MKKRLLAGIMAGVMAASVLVTGCGGSKDVKDGTFTPTKTIQWMCTSSAGGGSDIFTRKISDIMTAQNLVKGQTIVVTNKTDGSGEVGRKSGRSEKECGLSASDLQQRRSDGRWGRGSRPVWSEHLEKSKKNRLQKSFFL